MSVNTEILFVYKYMPFRLLVEEFNVSRAVRHSFYSYQFTHSYHSPEKVLLQILHYHKYQFVDKVTEQSKDD